MRSLIGILFVTPYIAARYVLAKVLQPYECFMHDHTKHATRICVTNTPTGRKSLHFLPLPPSFGHDPETEPTQDLHCVNLEIQTVSRCVALGKLA